MTEAAMSEALIGRTIALLERLVAFPTVSSDSNLEMIGFLAEHLSAAGAHAQIFADEGGGKANLFATFGPEAPGGLVLSGHTDVVPVAGQVWSSDPFTLRREGPRLYGRGTCDMKGFIAACLAVAPALGASRLARPVHMAFTHDEEVGCLGARALVPELAARGLRPAMAVIGEPTEMQIIEGHKGCCEYTVRFRGCEGHGSDPEGGVNAAEYAARYAGRLLELREDLRRRAPPESRFDPPETTINIGRIEGGVAHNVIAGRAEIDWEMRPVSADDEAWVKARVAELVEGELLPRMRARCPEAAIETEVIGEVAGLAPQEPNPARDLVARITGAGGAGLVPFGTEAGLWQAGLGLSAVVCGPGSIAQAHKPDEFIEVGQLARCLDMLGGLAEACAAP